MIRRALTIRGVMAGVALLAMLLGLIASEQWRWGYPRRVPFDHGNALSWMATVIRSDFRLYDGGDVQSLISYVARSGVLVGKSRDEVVELLGSPEVWALPPPSGSDGEEIYYSVGTVPRTIHAGPPVLHCRFGDDGRYVMVMTQGSW